MTVKLTQVCILRCDITNHYATILITPILKNSCTHLNNNIKPHKLNINHLDLLIKTEDCILVYIMKMLMVWLKFSIQK
jgi:hypothetical protein